MWDTGPLANQLIWFPEEGAEDNIKIAEKKSNGPAIKQFVIKHSKDIKRIHMWW